MSLEGTGRNGPDPEKLLDPEWVKAFLADVSAGVPILVAAEANGLNRWTFYTYLRRGGHPSVSNNAQWVNPEDAKEPYKTFVMLTVQSEAGAHRDIVKTVHTKVQNDVNAAIKYMRTRYADQYDPRNATTTVDLSEGSTQAVILSLEDFKRLTSREEANGG